ncbi:AMP-binding protein [bacterium]|nr:AMP-binding protein [bacterium]QQR58707.1 MAG: AMP-binding protein [Candidatus Melainabacteria bacterium]
MTTKTESAKDTHDQVIWKPEGKYLESRVSDFMRKQNVATWQELIKKSNEDTNWFWQESLEYMGFNWAKPYSKLMDMSKGFEWTKWFVDGKLNIIDNIIDFHLQDGKTLGSRKAAGKNHKALIWEGEDGATREFTYAELNTLVSKMSTLFLNLGVKPGDAVGIFMPMVPEVVAALFACLKIGAVAVPVFSGYGFEALAARLDDCEAKVLITTDGGMRRGKLVQVKKDADEAAKLLPHLKNIVVMKHCGNEINWTEGRDVWLHEAIKDLQEAKTNLELDAEHPSMYLYTSGTTGKPKGTVHTHAGALAQIAKEVGFCFDCQKDDVFFWFTDIGWMMGPWEMIGVAFWGGTLMIYEGGPDYPTPARVWEMVEHHKVTTLGIGPTAVRHLRAQGEQWIQKSDFSKLRMLGSTGEPWDQDSYMWLFEKIGQSRCPIINISGGTEVVGSLLAPLPLMPLKPCALGGPGLGMDIDVFDDNAKSLKNEIGYLVCKKPSPSMTKSFLKADDRYIETYFTKFPGVWYHGDWAKVDSEGSWFLFGRSDDTIKVAGKRVGPGEVESALVEHSQVAEAAVIGVPHEVKGECLVCFVVLNKDASESETLGKELKDLVSKKLGAVMKPERVHVVKALAKTRSGKIVRRAIRATYLNEGKLDLSSVENPDVLIEIKSLGSK